MAYAIACVVVHQRAHQLVARHSPVPVGEMLFAIGFTSGVAEACHCGCSAFVQDVLRGYSVDGTTNAMLASYVLLVVIVAQQAITFRGTWCLVFVAHYIQGGLIFLWASALIFQLAWQGCYESWCASPNLYTLSEILIVLARIKPNALGPLG